MKFAKFVQTNSKDPMKKIISLLFFLAAVMGHAQLLWKVSGGSLKEPSYLFASYHLMPGSFVDSVPGLNAAIKRVDCALVEIENEKMTAHATVKKMGEWMIAPTDSTIDVLLSKEAYQIVDAVVKRYHGDFGISLDKLKTMRPSALEAQFQQLMAIKMLGGINPNNLLDSEVERRVEALGKPVHSLETVDFQLQMLFGKPLNRQAADLLETCKNIDEVEQVFNDLHSAYTSQNFSKLMLAATNPVSMNEADMEQYCFQRNERWMPAITEAMKRGSVLVAVGAAHLGMEKGLIALLRQQGYTIEPVTK